jgi:hypothetical protein
MKENDTADELVISYLFPPSSDVSGKVLARRCIVEEKNFDVLQADVDDGDYEFSNLIEEYMNEQIIIDIDCNSSYPGCILDFVRKSMDELDKRPTYKRITTRVWKLANNFLGLEYKIRHPEVFWSAEFSDPLLFDRYNRKNDKDKKKDISDSEYLGNINSAIKRLNEDKGTDFDLLENPTNVHFLVEYSAYLFADEVVFTNVNQRQIMLSQFPVNVKDFVMQKSVIKPHPILPEKYYHLKEHDENLDSSKINIAYFGTFYSKRHFESIFYAFESLNHKHKDRLMFHFYISEEYFFNQLTENLEISDNVDVKNPIGYLEFLNMTTKLDVLLINDLITSDCFMINPYRPSKLSDYMGSGSDIWAVAERGSILDNSDLKYKSYLDDYNSNAEILVEILKDYGYDDEDYSIDVPEGYLHKRVTDLNVLLHKEHKKRNERNSSLRKAKRENERLKKQIEKLKNENSDLKDKNSDLSRVNEEILSSNSWKLTKNLRKVGSIVKK